MDNAVRQLLWWYYEQGVTDFLAPQRSHSEALNALQQEVEAFEKVALKKTAQHTVFSGGDPHSPLMFIGEAPGAEEDRLGEPFVGMSGKLLNMMLKAIRIQRRRIYITNIIPWRPPFNRQPTAAETEACLPFVERHIALIAPQAIVFLGGVACKALMRSGKSMAALLHRDLWYTHPDLAQPIRCFAFYHPSYLLRSPGQKRMAWHQLLRLRTFLQQHLPHFLASQSE